MCVVLTGAGYLLFLETCHKCDVSFASILKRRVSTVNQIILHDVRKKRKTIKWVFKNEHIGT